jgi:radical SAM superfamily enzyme YgiQ (UPF0313 family)
VARVVLISTYDLGHQPFGLASPKAWLTREGHDVWCLDLAVQKFNDAIVRDADLVAFFLPMHTATRLAIPVIDRVRRTKARIAAYGLYAPLNEELLRSHGVTDIIGGEFEPGLVAIASGRSAANISLEKLQFLTPERADLPTNYARLSNDKQIAYTEASRGCKHVCRHCPIVPIYEGQFRIVQRDVVLADIRQQIARGAQHVTFDDQDRASSQTSRAAPDTP